MGTSTTAVEQVNNIDRLLKQQSIYDANYDSDYDDYNDNCVATISVKSDTREVEPVNLEFGHLCREYDDKSIGGLGKRVHNY